MTMSNLSQKELKIIRRMCEERVDGEIKGHFIRNGKIYRQKDDLHTISDGCGCCWPRVSLSELVRSEPVKSDSSDES